MKTFKNFAAAALSFVFIAFVPAFNCCADSPLTRVFAAPGAELSAPAEWTVREPNSSSAQIAIQGRGSVYVNVWVESKADFIDTTLDAFAQRRLKEFAKNLETDSNQPAISSNSETVNMGEKNAYQYQVEGVFDGMRIVYLYTFVDGGDNYFRVLGWTLKSQFPAQHPVLQAITKSVREKK